MNRKFQKLTPESNMPLGIYEEALTYALGVIYIERYTFREGGTESS